MLVAAINEIVYLQTLLATRLPEGIYVPGMLHVSISNFRGEKNKIMFLHTALLAYNPTPPYS